MRRLCLFFIPLSCVSFSCGTLLAEEQEPSALEIEMWELVNADRAKNDQKALELDARLCSMARSHSKDMAEHNFFSHTSPTTGEPKDRFHKWHFAAFKTAENIAYHQSVKMAQVGLMHSPGHRKNLLDPDFTHIGIGIVQGADGQLQVTQNFMKPLPAMDLSKAPGELLARVNKAREAKGLPVLQTDAALQAICKANSRAMSEAGALSAETAKKEIAKKRGAYKGFRIHYQLLGSLDSLESAKDFSDPALTLIGLAVVQNEKKESGYGMLWVTMILASSSNQGR